MPSFGYTRDIPESDHSPSTDQPNMRTNTNSIDSLISIDHYSFEQLNFDGTHKQVQLRNAAGINGTIPAGLQGNGWETLYASTTAGNGELWFVRGASATGVQLTGPGTPTISGNGSTFLPGGLILNWGFYDAALGNFSSGSTSTKNDIPPQSLITLTTPFPNNMFIVGGNLTYSEGNLPSGTGTLNIRKSQLNSGPITTLSWQVYTDTNNYLGFVWWALGN